MRTSFALYSALFAIVSASAQASDCIEPNNQCTPVVGCILGASNELFLGEVLGVQQGIFTAKSNRGALCFGTFKRTQLGTAKVEAKCDDGRTAKATFAYFHQKTGTGRGKGRMSDGGKIVFWAGDQLWTYFRNLEESRPDELIACAINALDQSKEGGF